MSMREAALNAMVFLKLLCQSEQLSSNEIFRYILQTEIPFHDERMDIGKVMPKMKIRFPDIGQNKTSPLVENDADKPKRSRPSGGFFLPSVFTEKTQILPSTNLDNLLEVFRETNVEPQSGKTQKIVLQAKDIILRLTKVMRLTKYSHTVLPSNREPVLVGAMLDKTAILPGTDIDFLVPLIFSASFRKKDMGNGYATLALPDKIPGAKDVYSPIRAKTSVHLSATKVYEVFHRMLRRAARDISIPGISVDLSQMPSGSLDLVLQVGQKLRIHAIPTIAITCKQLYLVARPYDFDANVIPAIYWRYDYHRDEKKLFDRVTTADTGRRKMALKIVKAIAREDKRLSLISSYQLKTCLFQMIESEIDFYPGWQRKPLKSCVLELFENVHDAVESRWLPHTQLSGVNLFEHLPTKGHTLAVKLLKELSEEKGLVRFLRRSMATAEIQYFE